MERKFAQRSTTARRSDDGNRRGRRSFGSHSSESSHRFTGRPSTHRDSDGDEKPARFGRPSSGERSERPSRFGRTSREERPARFGRPSGGERSERPSRFGRASREERPARFGRPSGGERSERPSRFGRTSREERPARFSRPSSGERSERPSRFGRTSREERPARFSRPSRDERPSRYGRTAREDRPERSARLPKATKPAAPKEKEYKDEEGLVRLNKFIANSGICSRREADIYIETGLVKVNGEIVTELGTKIDPLKDDVRFNGERMHGEKKVYIIMNKPKDFVTTVSDPHADKTVMDLISPEKCPQRVYPVGRLDKATTGVLLFTNDGTMADKLTHPSNQVKKIYHAHLDKNLKMADFEAILQGITLEDGPIAADALSYVDDDKSQVGLEIHSGRNRIVRRIFEHLDYKVKKLDRVYFAGLTKKNIRRGEWRFLTEEEINLLKMGAVK